MKIEVQLAFQTKITVYVLPCRCNVERMASWSWCINGGHHQQIPNNILECPTWNRTHILLFVSVCVCMDSMTFIKWCRRVCQGWLTADKLEQGCETFDIFLQWNVGCFGSSLHVARIKKWLNCSGEICDIKFHHLRSPAEKWKNISIGKHLRYDEQKHCHQYNQNQY